MSKKCQYPNGYIGVVSDAVAVIMAKKKDHKILGDAPQPVKQNGMRNVTPEKAKE